MLRLSGLTEAQRDAALSLLTGMCCVGWLYSRRHERGDQMMNLGALNLGRAAMRVRDTLPEGDLRSRALAEVATAAGLLSGSDSDREAARVLAAFALAHDDGSLSAGDRAALEAQVDTSVGEGSRGGRGFLHRREPALQGPPPVPKADALGTADFSRFPIGLSFTPSNGDDESEPLVTVFREMQSVVFRDLSERAFRAVSELNHGLPYGHVVHSGIGTFHSFSAPERLLDPDGLADAAVWVLDNAETAVEELRRAWGTR